MSPKDMNQEEKQLLNDVRVLLNSRFLKGVLGIFMLMLGAITFFIQGMYSEMREIRVINASMMVTTATLVAEMTSVKRNDARQDSALTQHDAKFDKYDENIKEFYRRFPSLRNQ